jgi:hypothetical protein
LPKTSIALVLTASPSLRTKAMNVLIAFSGSFACLQVVNGLVGQLRLLA